MKRTITSMMILFALAFSNVFAQTVFFEEDFNLNTLGDWKAIDVDQFFLSTYARTALENASVTVPTNYTFSWGLLQSSQTNYVALSTSSYTPVGQANDWLISPAITISEGAVLEWSAKSFDEGAPESYQVLISTTDNEITSFTNLLLRVNNENPYFTRRFLNLDELGYKDQTVYIAFRNVSNNKWFLGLDDILVWQPYQFDLAALKINLSNYARKTSEGIVISANIGNLGLGDVQSFDFNYQADGEDIVTTTIYNPGISYYEAGTFTHPTLWNPDVLGTRTVKVWVSNINGGDATDSDLSNNEIEVTTFVWEGVALTPLFEAFTASTCPPCYSVGQIFNPILENNKEKITLVKYQMNWPGAGDIYYTEEGGTRRNYYGVNSVPMGFGNGESYPYSGTNMTQTGINNLINQPAFFEIQKTFYSVEDKKVTVKADIKSLGDFSGENIVVHVAVIENTTYNNKASNGETEFHNVMKKMLPNASGTKITNLGLNEVQSIDLSYTFPAVNTVEEFEDLSVVIWVQNVTTKKVLQSVYALKDGVSVPFEQDGSGIVAVFPNPSTEIARMRYAVGGEKNVSIDIFSVDGKKVSTIEKGLLPEGFYVEDFKVDYLPAGQYIIRLKVGDRVFSDKLNVIK